MQDIGFNYDTFIYWIYLMIKSIENQLENWSQSNVFDDARNKFVYAHCMVLSNVLTVTDENHKRRIFPISAVSWVLRWFYQNESLEV